MKLERALVAKPWGRTDLPAIFGETDGERIGEVWFTAGDDLPLLAKYLFTSEPLSIQNHPGSKEECWLVLDAEPDAVLGLGWKREVDRDEIRRAAADGSIVNMVAWKPVRPGDFYYVPAGTVHAIGAGISLLEFQQNSDITYRLYDYGRGRELNLDEAIAVARTGPYDGARARGVDPVSSAVLVDGPYFSLAHIAGNLGVAQPFEGRRRWVLPIEGGVRADGIVAGPGECLLLDPSSQIEGFGGRFLIGAEGRIE